MVKIMVPNPIKVDDLGGKIPDFLDYYPIIYRVLAPSHVVGNGISEPSTVSLQHQTLTCLTCLDRMVGGFD